MKIKKVDAGIHTLELYALRLTYSQCQKCMDTLADLAPLKVLRRDPYNIDRTLLSNALGSSGIRLIPWQSHDCSNGIGIIINPNLLLDCSCSPFSCSIPPGNPANGCWNRLRRFSTPSSWRTIPSTGT